MKALTQLVRKKKNVRSDGPVLVDALTDIDVDVDVAYAVSEGRSNAMDRVAIGRGTNAITF